MHLSGFARSTHTFISPKKLWLNPIQVMRYFGRPQLRHSCCAAFLEGFRISTSGFPCGVLTKSTAFHDELATIDFPVSPSVDTIVLLCKFGMQLIAETNEVARESPLRQHTPRFSRCSACNFRGFNECDFVAGRVVGWVSGEVVCRATSNDATTCEYFGQRVANIARGVRKSQTLYSYQQ